MAESTDTATGGQATLAPDTPATPPTLEAFKPITTQEEYDKVLAIQLSKEREKYKNYGQYKADSEELAKLKEASQSELDRLKDQLGKAIKEANELKAAQQIANWKAEVAAKSGRITPAHAGNT